MEPFRGFPAGLASRVEWVLTDVDDTLTHRGRLAASTYAALERLRAARIHVVPVTAAPAGWCDQMVRMWPIDGIVGENGGLWFVPEPAGGPPLRALWLDEAGRRTAMERLAAVAAEIVAAIPGAALAADQPYRETTVAIEFATPAGRAAGSGPAADFFRRAGARATVNSLWVIGWFGGFDKLAAARRMMGEVFAIDLDTARERILYVGDSLNDEPMFAFFPHSAGVATVRRFAPAMAALPRWVTDGPGGAGFVELADALLRERGTS